MNNNTIKPFMFSPLGTCLECKAPALVLMLKDVDALRIQETGELSDILNLSHKSMVVCVNCNSEFNYIKQGNYVKPISDPVHRVKMYKLATQGAHENPFNI